MNEFNKKIEKENERRSWVIAIGLHAIFFILAGLGLFSCWTKPNPLVIAGEVSVVFGEIDAGNGQEKEPATIPKPQQSQPIEEVVPEVVKDPDSDLLPDVVDVPDPKPEPVPEPTPDPKPDPEPTPDLKPTPDPDAFKMPGGGNNESSEKEGDSGGVKMESENGGVENNTQGSGGDGLAIDGWQFTQKPSKPNITTSGIAHLEFKINAFGKVIPGSVKVIGGAYSAKEREIIAAEFMKIKLSRTSGAITPQSFYSGTYDWKLQY